MRIVGGHMSGRALAAPWTKDVRPTSDRLRETIFNIIESVYRGAIANARVIDLFAGTGALGFEALSRGASYACFVDDGMEARVLLKSNAETLGVEEITRIMRRDATRLGVVAGAPFTLAFLDPPYGKNLAGPALAALRDGLWLAPGALVVVEEAESARFTPPPDFVVLDRRGQGETQVCFCRPRAAK